MFNLMTIRMQLRGARQVAAESKIAQEAITGVAAAADKASASSAAAGARLTAMGGRMKAIGGKISAVGRGLRSMAVPMLAVGGAAVYLSAKFGASMEAIHTQAGASQAEVNSLTKQVKDFASSTATQSPDDLANALYRLEGAGLRGAKAMNALKASSLLATVGQADVEDTAKTLAQTWFVGIKGAGTFKDTVAELNATVGQGDLRLQQLVDALGTGILPAAKAAGLSMHDVTGALAVFGDMTNNVSGFTAQFATALHYLTNPGDKASKALAQLNLSQEKMVNTINKPRGFLTVLGELKSRLEGLPGGIHGPQAQGILGDILPGGRGRVLLVLMDQLDRYRQKMGLIKKTHKDFGESVHASMELPINKLRHAWAALQVSLIDLGSAIMPIVVPALQSFANVLISIITWFTKLPQPIQTVITDFGLILIVATPLIIALGAVISAIGGIIEVAGAVMASEALGGLLLFLPEVAGAALAAAAAFEVGKIAIGLFSGGGDEASKMEVALKGSSDTLTSALKRQNTAQNNLAGATKFLDQLRKRQKKATDNVHAAEVKLLHVRKRYGPDSKAATLQELKLARAQHKTLSVTKQLQTAERMHGAQLRLYKRVEKTVVAAEKQRIGVLQDQRKKLLGVIKADLKNHAGAAKLADDQKRWNKNATNLSKAQKQMGDTLTDVADKAGAKYADFLAKSSPHTLRFGDLIKTMNGRLTTNAQGFGGSKQSLQGFLDVINRSNGSLQTMNDRITTLNNNPMQDPLGATGSVAVPTLPPVGPTRPQAGPPNPNKHAHRRAILRRPRATGVVVPEGRRIATQRGGGDGSGDQNFRLYISGREVAVEVAREGESAAARS